MAIDSRAALDLPEYLLLPSLVNACSYALGITNRNTAQPGDMFAGGLIG